MNNSKTRAVIVWPDGFTEYPTRTRHGWKWSGVTYDDNGKAHRYNGTTWSSHLDSVKQGIADAGGTFTREPNPYYRATQPSTGGLRFDVFTGILRG